METMKAFVRSWLVACFSLCAALPAAAQTPVGALAVDERRGDQYGWAVDYETEAAAWEAALSECGAGCSVVLTFARCGAYAADQDADSTAVGWAESYTSADGARQAALSECRSRGGGSGCIVRAWGCNGPVVEEGLGLDRATRRLIQQGLGAKGFDAGVADGLFGPRTRAAIRNWQSARGARSTGYLDGSQVEALRGRGGSQPSASTRAGAGQSEELEVVFWQSIQNSTNSVEFEAYLEQFPNGVFRGTGTSPAGGAAWFDEWRHYGSGAGRRRDRDIGFRTGGFGSVCIVARDYAGRRRSPTIGCGGPPQPDVRRQAGRGGMLDGDFRATRVPHLEWRTRTGRNRNLDGGVCRWLRSGSGNAHVGLG